MNRVIVILLLVVMTNCKSPSIQSDPEPISCKKATLVLDTWGINLPVWEHENRGHTYTIEGSRIYVTLSSITPGYLSEWLFDNNPFVKFEESLRGILCHHIIPDIDKFETGKVNETWTYKQIQDTLIKRGHPLRDTFRQYVELSFNDRNRLELKPTRSFEPTKYYYSMAFFMAVGRAHNFDGATSFTFHTGTYGDNPVIIIEVIGGGHKNFYDFAQYPPLK